MSAITVLPPMGRYVRRIEGANFSLEANTERVPEAGHYYLLQNGDVVLQSDDYPEAMLAYQGLCKVYWEDHLSSAELPERLSSAWGLIGLESEHVLAVALIREEGTAADRKRLDQMRLRSRFARNQGNRGRQGRTSTP